MNALIIENNGLTVIENLPRAQPQTQGPNNIAYVGVAPEADASLPRNQVIELTDEVAEKLDPNEAGTSTVLSFYQQARQYTPGRLFAVIVDASDDIATMKANIIGTNVGRERTGIYALLGTDSGPTLIASDMSQDVDVALTLGIVAGKLLAIAIVNGPSTTKAEAIALRDALAGEVGRHICIIDGMGSVFVDGETVYLPAPLLAIGALASRPINNSPHGTTLLVNGVDTDIEFNFIDLTTEGNELNTNRVNFIKPIAGQGVQIIGHHNANGEFYSHTGLAIVLKRLVIAFFTARIGPDLTDDFVASLIDEFNDQLYLLQQRGVFPKGNISINRELNTQLENGRGRLYLVIDIDRYAPAVQYVVEINYQDRSISIN